MTDPRPYRIVPAAAEHARGLADCHIVCWREAYRGLVPNHVLDAFDIDQRTEAWTRRLGEHPGRTTVALADDTVIGFITLGPAVYRPIVTPTRAERPLRALTVVRIRRRRRSGADHAEPGDPLLAVGVRTEPTRHRLLP